MGLPAGIETYFDPCVLNKLAYNHKYPPEDTRQKTEKNNLRICIRTRYFISDSKIRCLFPFFVKYRNDCEDGINDSRLQQEMLRC